MPYEDPVLDIIAPESPVEEAAANSSPGAYSVPDFSGSKAASRYSPPQLPVANVGSIYVVPDLRQGPPQAPLPQLPPLQLRVPPPPPDPKQVKTVEMGFKDKLKLFEKGFGPGQLPDPKTVPLKGLADRSHWDEQTRGVNYIADKQKLRSKYEVKIGYVLTRRLETFDTRQIKATFAHRRGTDTAFLSPEDKVKPFSPKQRSKLGAAFLGRTAEESNTTWKLLGREWGIQSLIWVCSLPKGRTLPAFYSHVGKLHRFHHSSFLEGGDVIGAGEWIVEKGQLRKISANSGHYQPTVDMLHRSVLYMAAAWRTDTVVLLWNTIEDGWEEVPVVVFKDNPTGGGKWKAHPNNR